MAVQIEPVQIWNNGEVTEATWLSCICSQDNLKDSALFSYSLCSDIEGQIGVQLASGNVTMNEPEYSDWTNNQYAYEYVANMLSITIINQ